MSCATGTRHPISPDSQLTVAVLLTLVEKKGRVEVRISGTHGIIIQNAMQINLSFLPLNS